MGRLGVLSVNVTNEEFNWKEICHLLFLLFGQPHTHRTIKFLAKHKEINNTVDSTGSVTYE